MTTPGSPADRIEPKFKVGDWVVYCNEDVDLITGIEDNGYLINKCGYIPFVCENDMHLIERNFSWSKEDERIRRAIIEALKQLDREKCPVDTYPYLDWAAWLEKQGKKLNIPQDTEDDLRRQSTIQVLEYARSLDAYNQYGKEDIDKDITWLKKQVEQKPVDKVEQKFKVGDIMRTLREASDGFTDGMPVVVSIDDEYYHCTNELIAIKNQDDYEYPPMNRRQNLVWSKEDEEMIDAVIADIQFTQKAHTHEVNQVVYEREIDWLKSLKDRMKGE